MRSAVIAGGRASRFDGRAKGLELVGGERILDRVVSALEEAGGLPPVLIANDSDAPNWIPGNTVVGDLIPDRGVLGGIYTAVSIEPSPVLVVAWDMPFIPSELLRKLIQESHGYDVFLPASDGPRGVEPLCGVYGPACAEPIRKQLETKNLKAIGFHDQVKTAYLPLEEVAQFGATEKLFFNVNNAEDLRKAEDTWLARA